MVYYRYEAISVPILLLDVVVTHDYMRPLLTWRILIPLTTPSLKSSSFAILFVKRYGTTVAIS